MIATLSEQELLESLRAGKSGAFEQIYRNYYRMVAGMIQKNSGSEEEIEDVFQETLFILVKKLRQPDFKLTAKLGTFLYSISRNLWLQKLQKKGKSPLVNLPEDFSTKTIVLNTLVYCLGKACWIALPGATNLCFNL